MLRTLTAAAALAALATPLLAQEPAGVRVEIAIARDVVDRMPVDTASAFPADVGTLTCWTRVTGVAGSTLQHVWIHGPHESTVTLDIGGSPWRTWSTKQIPPEWTGEWRVEVRDSAGTVLATARFTVGG